MATTATTRKKTNVDETLERLPDGGAPLEGVYDPSTVEMLELSEQLVEQARQRLGTRGASPRPEFRERLEAVDELFASYAGQPPEVTEKLDHDLRGPKHVEQVAQLDEDWDKSCAQALNAYDNVAVTNAARVHTAEDNWRLGIRIFESESRSASAIYRAEIDKAHGLLHPEHREGQRDGYLQLDHYTRSTDISTALTTYQESMATATADLATAFGTLITELVGASTATAVGEATLINATQTASKTFWTAAQDELTDQT